jgi:hypothetical protein
MAGLPEGHHGSVGLADASFDGILEGDLDKRPTRWRTT